MAKYRKVDPRIWNDAKFRSLSETAQFVFFFILTHPHLTALGAMRATLNGLAEEIGRLPEAFREAFQEGVDAGMIRHDPKACFVWLPNFLKYNGPESPNVVKAWASSLDMLPECDLKVELCQHVKGFVEGLQEAFTKALPEAFLEGLSKGMPYQKQKQKQEQKQEQERREETFSPSPTELNFQIAEKFNTPEIRSALSSFSELQFAIHRRRWAPQAAEATLMRFSHWTPEKLLCAINFSISKSAKSILDPDMDFETATANSGRRPGATAYKDLTSLASGAARS